MNTISTSSRPGLLHLCSIFLRVGAFTFGGGFAMLPIIQRELVEKQGWLQDEEFIDMIALTQSAPGPIAVNAAVYLGYRLRGMPGAGVAVVGVTLPSLLTILTIAYALSNNSLSWLDRVFAGIRPTVVALVASAAYSLGRRSLPDGISWGLLGLTVIALLVFDLHPVLVVAAGAIVGLIWRPEGSVTR